MTDTRRLQPRTRRIIAFDPRAFGWGVGNRQRARAGPLCCRPGMLRRSGSNRNGVRQGCNELFVVRVAGNVLGQECLGSLKYAVSHFHSTLKLVVVLSHAQCGAVTEAVNLYLEPRSPSGLCNRLCRPVYCGQTDWSQCALPQWAWRSYMALRLFVNRSIRLRCLRRL